MTLTAIREDTKERVMASAYEDNWVYITENKHLWRDPIFNQPVTPKRTHLRGETKVRAHFYSTASNVEADDWEFDSEYAVRQGKLYQYRESQTHIDGKAIILTHGQEVFPELQGSEAQAEARIELPNGRYRIADVLFKLRSGLTWAHECQLAAISVAELELRTDSYLSGGIDVTWWFGGAAATPSNLEWHINFFGYSAPVFRVQGS
ncbi:MAG TPA: competence protein CoiA family protein [Coleofasciculaceae cyanobacterium]|jgi:hypothetical protein